MKTLLRNILTIPVSLPYPYKGLLPAGAAIPIDSPAATVLSNLGGAAVANGIFELREVPDSQGTSLYPTPIFPDSAGLFTLSTIVSTDDTALLGTAFNTLVRTKASATRDVPSALSVWQNQDLPNDPAFADGNPYIAGIGLEAKGTYYRDSLTGAWALIASIERTGTYATVGDGVRRASYESYIQNGDEKPWIRFASDAQGMQIGGGGYALAGSATRSGTTLTVVTRAEHKLGAGAMLYKQTIGGAAEFGADGEWLRVAGVTNATTFTVTVANSGITVNTLPISFTNEAALDVVVARGAYGTLEHRVANAANDGVDTIYAGSRSIHSWYIGGARKAFIDSDGLHYTPGSWSNGGSQTQTGQDTFYVAGATTTLDTIANCGGTGTRRRVWNNRASGSVTVSFSGGNTRQDAVATTYVIANPGEGCDFDALGNVWFCAGLIP